jgi:hypothetical protein
MNDRLGVAVHTPQVIFDLRQIGQATNGEEERRKLT